MIKRISPLIFLILVVVGCTRGIPTPLLPTETSAPRGRSSPTVNIPSGDFAARWDFVNDPLVVNINDRFLVVHGLYLGPETILVYSENGPKSGTDIPLEVVDNKGRKLLVHSTVHLDPVDSIQFSVVKFAHRKPGANSLFIETGSNRVELVRHSDSSESENSNHGEFGLYTTSAIKQGKFSISVVNWLYTPVTPPSDATSLPPNVEDENRFTLQVEDTANHDSFYYLIQFLSNGEIIGTVAP